MNSVQLGQMFEQQAINVLKLNNYTIKEYLSKTNWSSNFDILVSKDNIDYYVEVRGRDSILKSFVLDKNKLNRLLKYPNGLLFLINRNSYIIIDLKLINKEGTTIIEGYRISGSFKNANTGRTNSPLKILNRCTACNITQTYYRRTTNTRKCKNCDFIEKLREVKQ